MIDQLQLLDYLGVAIFAATGALAASRAQLDIVGFVFFATATGIGGGTLRDLLLGVRPIFWIADGSYLAVCTLAAIVVYLTAPHFESRFKVLLWADALGLSCYCVAGAAKGLDAGAGFAGAIVMGLMTATFGGIIRDVLAGERSVILRQELYLTPALCGAATYAALARLGSDPLLAVLLGILAALLLRAGALTFGWTIPVYRNRPGRDYPDTR